MGYCRYIRHYEWRYNDRNDCGIYHIHHSNNEGTEEFEGLRVMCYERADVFIVCYSLAKPASASNVRLLKWIRVSLWADEPFSLQALRKWIPEVRRHRPSVPVVLVATQASRCHKPHKSLLQVISKYRKKQVISRKSTVANILHPDRPSWLPSITFPPGEEPRHTQVATRLIAQVLEWC